jgi:hypothetical protein
MVPNFDKFHCSIRFHSDVDMAVVRGFSFAAMIIFVFQDAWHSKLRADAL